MAGKKTFPMLPGNHWWALRAKFKQSIPGVVTDNYLSAALRMQPKSARANVLPYLKDIGLVDEEGKTQDIAKAWRDDQQYAEVCKQIRERVYPDELPSAAPDPSADRETISRWFAQHTGAGNSAVRRMTQFYIILAEADLAKSPKKKANKPKKADKKAKEKKTEKKDAITTPTVTKPPVTAKELQPTTGVPGVSINLEIHISADATPDQIDKIFESMAKHIYRR